MVISCANFLQMCNLEVVAESWASFMQKSQIWFVKGEIGGGSGGWGMERQENKFEKQAKLEHENKEAVNFQLLFAVSENKLVHFFYKAVFFLHF